MRRAQLDLTALVDIILIIFFAVTIGLKKKHEQVQAKLEQQLAAKSAQLQKIQQQKASPAARRASEKQSQELQTLAQRLRHMMTRIKGNRQLLLKQREGWRTKSHLLEQELRKLLLEKQKLKEEKMLLQQQKLKFMHKAKQLKEKQRNLEKRYQQLEHSRSDLEQQLAESSQKYKQLEKRQQKTRKLLQQLRAQHQLLVDDHRSLLLQAKALKKKNFSLQAKVQTLSSANRDLQAKLESSKQRRRQILASFYALQKKYRSLFSKLDPLQVKIRKMTDMRSDLEQKRRKLETKQKSLEEAQKAILKWKQRLKKLQSQNRLLYEEKLLLTRDLKHAEKEKNKWQLQAHEWLQKSAQHQALREQREKEYALLKAKYRKLRLKIKSLKLKELQQQKDEKRLKLTVQRTQREKELLFLKTKRLLRNREQMSDALEQYKIFGRMGAKEHAGLSKSIQRHFVALFIYVSHDQITGYKRSNEKKKHLFEKPIELSRRTKNGQRLRYRGRVEQSFRALSRLQSKLPSALAKSKEAIWIIIFDDDCSLAVTSGLEDEHQRFFSSRHVIWQL